MSGVAGVAVDQDDVIIRREGAAGVLRLNRPKTINALTLEMVRHVDVALDRFEADAAVALILLEGAGERGLCAGGDIRGLYDSARVGGDLGKVFWGEEYIVNARIDSYPKPYVAFMDGIVMGGGVGVSVHGSHRVAGDRFRFAMPEVGIGFFPDVGATWFLPRLPGEVGTYCALTGERLDAADGIAAGIATHRVASARFAELADALCGAVPVDAILAKFAESSPSPRLRGEGRGRGPDGGTGKEEPVMARRTAIERMFAAARVEDILYALDSEAASASADAEWSRLTAAAIRTKAPLSLKIALAQMRRGRTWPFEACMKAEMRIVSRVAYGEDFYEGIRAVIVDKDNRPRWRPTTLAEVTDASVEAHFAPIAAELALP